MAFLDQLGSVGRSVAKKSGEIGKTVAQKSGELGKSVAQKSGEIAESGKLSMNIKKKEKEIRNIKFEIGKYVYQAYKNGQVFDDMVQAYCEAIDAAYSEIAEYEAERDIIGTEHVSVEVVEADFSDDTFEISAEEEEILNDL